jgi:hypothetical protein
MHMPTPFRSFYGANIPEGFSIDFFYAYSGDDGAYLEELRAIDKDISGNPGQMRRFIDYRR